jgi:phosphate:Na+ symporter
MNPLLSLVDWISSGVGIHETSYSMKLAVFHTLFNLLGVAIMTPVVRPMTEALIRFIPDKTPSRLQPRHLHDSAIGYADTATESVRKETLHVWENTIDLVAHSINVPKEQVIEVNDALNATIKRSKVTDSFDLDRFYQLRIKSLYSAIIGFISRASFSWDMEQSGEVHWLRKANQDMVDAIKNIKHLRKNMIHYTQMPNTVIKQQYDAIRLEVARVVSSIEQIRHANPEQMPSLMIDQIRLEIDSEYKEYNKSVSELIQHNRIDNEMAISLMNDLSYLYNFSTHLLDMAHTLFIKHNKALSGAEKSVQLDEQELREIQDRHESEAN